MAAVIEFDRAFRDWVMSLHGHISRSAVALSLRITLGPAG